MHAYYSRRAQEYEAIYHRNDPLRQSELGSIRQRLREIFKNKRVLEIACGTGYWTEAIADIVKQITATDFSLEVLEIAKSKSSLQALQNRVIFQQADAYELDTVNGTFDAGLANFWFSHIPKAKISHFLKEFHKKVGRGAVVFMCDNVYVPGVGGELIQKQDSSDTYKLRTLSDGSTHEVLKNYFTRDELKAILGPCSTELDIHIGQCYWWTHYRAG
ncbi:methyltransferase domain-containing protein [Candidatus Acetothermia bacterium]|nr:methyltransferase domain-containing protein [Candidatus Acetothermia bacterium]MBI3643873.1 methyltransferase domain-containing protein [Candidatus Acetothermia bacterium]